MFMDTTNEELLEIPQEYINVREKLHSSILKAGDAVHPKYPTDYYLDPVTPCIQWHTRTGAGVPTRAYCGIWIKILRAPAGAIPESVVENLLKVEDQLIYDCENNFQGTKWNGHNHIGIWENKPNYSLFQFEINTF